MPRTRCFHPLTPWRPMFEHRVQDDQQLRMQAVSATFLAFPA